MPVRPHHLDAVPHYNQRYVFVTSTPLEPRKGFGTATAVFGLMQALHERGKRVGLVEPGPSTLWPALHHWRFNRHVPRWIEGLDVDCVVGIDDDGYRYAARSGRKPFVALLHGVFGDEAPWESGATRRRLKRRARCEGQSATAADLVVVPSAYSARRTTELYGVESERVHVIPNGLDLEQWGPLPPRNEGPPVLLTVAQLIPRKGIDLLLDAWAIVTKQLPAARLHLLGDGPQRAHLEAMAARLGLTQSVRFFGSVGHRTVREYLAGCDAVCLPSQQEAFGMVLLEAMASGRPVVATAGGAMPEVVGSAGQIVVTREPEDLAKALTHLLADRNVRAGLIRAGLERATEFAWPAIATRFGALLGSL